MVQSNGETNRGFENGSVIDLVRIYSVTLQIMHTKFNSNMC